MSKIIHVYRETPLNGESASQGGWEAINERGMQVGWHELLNHFRMFSKDGKLHRGLNPNRATWDVSWVAWFVEKDELGRERPIRRVKVYWYEQKD